MKNQVTRSRSCQVIADVDLGGSINHATVLTRTNSWQMPVEPMKFFCIYTNIVLSSKQWPQFSLRRGLQKREDVITLDAQLRQDSSTTLSKATTGLDQQTGMRIEGPQEICPSQEPKASPLGLGDSKPQSTERLGNIARRSYDGIRSRIKWNFLRGQKLSMKQPSTASL